MDLEKLNRSYEKTKRIIETKQKRIKKIETEIQIAIEDIQILKVDEIRAHRANDKVELKAAEKEIEDRKKIIENLKKELEEEKEEMEMFQEKVDNIIETIKENPEMKEHMNQVLAKRYSRKLKVIDKERKEITNKVEEEKSKKEKENEKIEKFEIVKKLIEEHPSMANHMQGMLNANATIKKLDEELSKLDIKKDENRISEIKEEAKIAQGKLTKNKDAILTYTSKNKIKITEQTLNDIMENSVINKKTNQVNVNDTINNSIQVSKTNIAEYDKQIKYYNKQLKGYDKTILYNNKAITKLGYKVPKEPQIKEEENEIESNENHTEEKLTDGEEKLKWWQFIKRFKSWNQSKKLDLLPEPEEKKSREENKEFASSLKYQVVKDITNQLQVDTIKEVKQEEKANVTKQSEQRSR